MERFLWATKMTETWADPYRISNFDFTLDLNARLGLEQGKSKIAFFSLCECFHSNFTTHISIII